MSETTARELFDVWLKRVRGCLYNAPTLVKLLGKADKPGLPKGGTFDDYLAYFKRENCGLIDAVGVFREVWKVYEADRADPANPKLKEEYGYLWLVGIFWAVVLYFLLSGDPVRQNPRNWTEEDWKREEWEAWQERRWRK